MSDQNQQQQQNQQKGQNQQQKASPGITATLPLGMNDIDRPDTMARVSLVSIVIGVAAIGMCWLFQPFKQTCFPTVKAPAGPDLSDIKGTGKAIADTGKGVPYAHEVFNNLAPEQQKALAEGLAKRAGLTVTKPE